MKLEAKFNKWLVGAVMGKKYVWEHEHLVEEYHQEEEVVISTKKEASSLKNFLQGGVEELKHNVRNVASKKSNHQPTDSDEGR